MASSKELPEAGTQNEAPADCLWTNLPEEITQEILKSLCSHQTVTYFRPWWRYTKQDEHYLMEYEMNKLTGHVLPKLFMISKTVFNKSEVVTAILRYARTNLKSSKMINYLAAQLTESQKAIMK